MWNVKATQTRLKVEFGQNSSNMIWIFQVFLLYLIREIYIFLTASLLVRYYLVMYIYTYTYVSVFSHLLQVYLFRTVPELEILTILPDLTLNFGRQVRQARLPTITAVALGPSY